MAKVLNFAGAAAARAKGPPTRALRGGKRAHRAVIEIPFGGGTKIKSKGIQRKRALIKGPLGVDKKTKNESRSCLKARFH